MKINKNTLFNIVENIDYIQHHVKYQSEAKKFDSSKSDEYDDSIELFKTTGYRKLVLSKKTKDNLVNYKVPKEIRNDLIWELKQVSPKNCPIDAKVD